MDDPKPRFGWCACGNVYDLETGLRAETPALLSSKKEDGDRERCLACWLDNDQKGWPGR